MRILYVTPAFHHPRLRGPTRCYHFARELAKRNAVTLLALAQSPPDPEALAEMESRLERVEVVPAGPRGGRPRSGGWRGRLAARLARRRGVARLVRRFRELAASGRYDVVLFHGKILARALDGHEAPPLAIDFCDATSLRLRQRLRRAPPAARLWCLLRSLAVRRTERRLLRATRHVAFISPRDRDAVLAPGDRGELVPNGVDHAFFRPQAAERSVPTLVLSGVMSYGPNEDAALRLVDEVLPLVRRSVPDAEVVIVGREPSARLRERAGRPGVHVTGFVPDVRPFLANASVFVAPLRFASGVQNKVLEALAMGVPVVTTPEVADGLRLDGGLEAPVAVARQAGELADRIVKLLGEPAERERLAAEGRRFVEEHFDWARSAQRLEELCRRACTEAAAEGSTRGLAGRARRPRFLRVPRRRLS
jgi:sugar transferase (PEP-CTERM/EpsH1 system associated)